MSPALAGEFFTTAPPTEQCYRHTIAAQEEKAKVNGSFTEEVMSVQSWEICVIIKTSHTD